MAGWREYQEETAALFRSLGLDAATDTHVPGVRGGHDVDVVVRHRRAGLEQLWVVECKQRRRPVEKLHVAALAEIVRDVGADRGILVSEVGFQSGAQEMARSSNITLTSLAELRRTTVDELLTLRLGESRLRLAHLRKRLGAVGQIDRRGHGVLSRSYRQAPGHWDVVKLHAAMAIAATGIERAETGRWPAPYAWDFSSDGQRHAADLPSFVNALSAALDEMETELVAVEEANS